MDTDGRRVPQGEPMTPPEDPPESKVPNKSSETGDVANGGNVNNGAGNNWNEAFPDEEAAEFIKKYGLTTYLMVCMLKDMEFGQAH